MIERNEYTIIESHEDPEGMRFVDFDRYEEILNFVKEIAKGRILGTPCNARSFLQSTGEMQ